MALREFMDQSTPWRAWDVRPTGALRPGSPLPTAPGLEAGWICFESAGEKRRLAPIPEGWEVWSEERLRASLAEARATGRKDAVDDPADPSA